MAPAKRSSRRTADRRRPRATRSRRLRIVITAGPTREYLDAVRFLSNPSSGKMGYAIAEAALQAGHRVTLISGPVALEPLRGARTIRVTTAAEMAAAAKRAFRSADAAILTAAVCDYRPRVRAARKLAKTPRPKSVVLVPTEDIAAALGRIKGHRVTIAFAMETHAARRHAEAKMVAKRCDAIVLNGPENVGSDRARVQFLVRGGVWQRWPAATKRQISARLIEALSELLDRCGHAE
ncbi:MAG: phosphopantothenoylcysteine decarboxylase [Phycisphaerae bacterium]